MRNPGRMNARVAISFSSGQRHRDNKWGPLMQREINAQEFNEGYDSGCSLIREKDLYEQSK